MSNEGPFIFSLVCVKTSAISMKWSTTLQPDPLWTTPRHHHRSPVDEGGYRLVQTYIVEACCSVADILSTDEALLAFREAGKCGQVALADYISRLFASVNNQLPSSPNSDELLVLLEPLDRHSWSLSSKNSSRRKKLTKKVPPPYVLERTDVTCSIQLNGEESVVKVCVRILVYRNEAKMTDSPEQSDIDTLTQISSTAIENVVKSSFDEIDAMNFVATVTLQENLRNQLESEDELNAIAFIADKAILPRKSGANQAPMASPPAIPFLAPEGSTMSRKIRIPLAKSIMPFLVSHMIDPEKQETEDSVVLTGLIVPRGVSLIVGGGYHGKSTLLRAIAAGVYNKIPGDGREFCVTVAQALSVRAEDGRYVNNCNVSGFIANLPAPPPMNGHATKPPDTKHFSTGEASGSTSQAANVIEAMEMKASAFLVDEDVSAANFMARDGRMRALVMDESITPLLYRVNGLFNTHGVSSVVVVGGVGDWLDVPHNVILMQHYSCFDATAKARSVSKQFSHGHVQYGGRGVVHRLEWDKNQHTPTPRRPTDDTFKDLEPQSTVVGLLEGGTGIAFHRMQSDESSTSPSSDGDTEDDQYIDMSRCEQLLGKKPQLYACGMAVMWVLQASRKNPGRGLSELLDMLDKEIDSNGLLEVLAPKDSVARHELVETLGYAYRPRRLEVGQALCRLRGIRWEELPMEEDVELAKAKAEEERKKRELMEIWNRRRKNKLADGQT